MCGRRRIWIRDWIVMFHEHKSPHVPSYQQSPSDNDTELTVNNAYGAITVCEWMAECFDIYGYKYVKGKFTPVPGVSTWNGRICSNCSLPKYCGNWQVTLSNCLTLHWPWVHASAFRSNQTTVYMSSCDFKLVVVMSLMNIPDMLRSSLLPFGLFLINSVGLGWQQGWG